MRKLGPYTENLVKVGVGALSRDYSIRIHVTNLNIHNKD